MHWKKSRVVINRWDANNLRITETMELDGRPFTLEFLADPDQEPIAFSTLREAQGHAEVLNELTVVRADNDRLRAELAQSRGQWPTPAESAALDETALEALAEADARARPPDAGLGPNEVDDQPEEIAHNRLRLAAEPDESPANSPAVAALAAELVQVMAAAPGASASGTAARLARQGERETARQAAADCGADGRGVPSTRPVADPWFN